MGINIIEHPYRILYAVVGALSLLVPFYTWKRLFQQWHQLKETKLFYQRHNCCVTYYKDKGFAGWPPYTNRLGLSLDEGVQIYEPVLYFLRTAQYNLKIAVMLLNVSVIEETLCDLARKGINVQLLMDYDRSDAECVQKLKRAGVQVKLFINTDAKSECIMHHKYAIKDYSEKDSGFLLFGSLNWSFSGFTNNYEDIVFTTNVEAVKNFNDNFKNTWDYLDNLEKQNVTVRAILNNKVKVML